MNNMHVTILTDSGPHIGQGHIQRMLLLADYLLSRNVKVTVVHKTNEHIPPFAIPISLSSNIPSCNGILRDMRDSTIDEMNFLKNVAPVIAIDDCGQGRSIANVAIDLLPNVCTITPNTFQSSEPLFLYGYNFYTSLKHAPPHIVKDIDCCIYATTFDPHELLHAITCQYSYVCITSQSRYTNISQINDHKHYIARSKVLITHFGISVYEAMLCNTHCIVLNPSPYHQILSNALNPHHILYHTQLISSCHMYEIADLLRNYIAHGYAYCDTRECLHTIESNLKNFYNALLLILTT